MEILVTARSNYGVTAYYPANDAAHIIARIAGTKTLTMRVLELASAISTVVIDGDGTLRQLIGGIGYNHKGIPVRCILDAV